MSKYILDNNSIIDTSELIPHVECYYTDFVNGKPVLYCESIDGHTYSLGVIKEEHNG